MNIGFDAKRYFNNSTGLGNYSRALIDGLSIYFPENTYSLFHTKRETSNFPVVYPNSFINKIVPAYWRTFSQTKVWNEYNIDVFHGLSNEIPFTSHRFSQKKIVTIHDILFEDFPQDYSYLDSFIYRKKTKYSIANADTIIAISEQTKADIIERYQAKENKIKVVYQSTLPLFYSNEKSKISDRLMYLPLEYLLYVGSIIERKNLLTLCEALRLSNFEIPLIIVGDGKKYKQEVKEFIANSKLKHVIFLNETIKNLTREELKFLYENAQAMIYPSLKEGFGIPVLEALCCDCPVITTAGTSMEEIAADAALYVNGKDVEHLKNQIEILLHSTSLQNQLKAKGKERKALFTLSSFLQNTISCY